MSRPNGESSSQQDEDERVPPARDLSRGQLLDRVAVAVREAHALRAASQERSARSEAALQRAIEGQAQRRAERVARVALEADVRGLASRLRADGATPEVGLRVVKTALESVLADSWAPESLERDWRRHVMSDAVRWFVEAYYAA